VNGDGGDGRGAWFVARNGINGGDGNGRRPAAPCSCHVSGYESTQATDLRTNSKGSAISTIPSVATCATCGGYCPVSFRAAVSSHSGSMTKVFPKP
jgi:hypothetical protein